MCGFNRATHAAQIPVVARRGIIPGVQTETVTPTGNVERARRTALAHLFDRRLALIVALALLFGALAYQTPAQATLNVGWLGDQLFLPTSEGLGQSEIIAGRWFGDELTDDAPTGRSRWTRSRALATLSGLGVRGETTLVLVNQGWPTQAGQSVAQPTVDVRVNNTLIDSFQPTASWAERRMTIPAALAGGDMQIELRVAPTFASPDDGRPKGVRVAQLRVEPGAAARPYMPPLIPLAWLALSGMLGYLAAGRALQKPRLAFALALAVLLELAVGLALARMWTAVLLPWASLALALLLLATCWRVLWQLLHAIVERFTHTNALSNGLVVVLVGWTAYLLVRGVMLAAAGGEFVPPLLLGLIVALLLWLRPIALAALVERTVTALNTRRVALVLLAGFLVAWLGYEAWVVAALPGPGHADYADNAVVARNLVAGRGWVVDYVTQFYMLYNGLTRPQETWPLLQPVWIAPFFLLFGATDWAAKIPNLIFTVILGVLVYRFGARAWDRRVGLFAAIMLLTSYLFFVLVINVTSDLGFVVLAFAVVSEVYRWGQHGGVRSGDAASPFRLRRVALLGLLTGLMFWQKPANGVFLATGCGVWLLFQLWRARRSDGVQPPLFKRLMPIALWSVIAIAIFVPYLARNLVLSAQNNHIYGSLVYSTESRDAWVLEYAPYWGWIYKIYTPDGGLSETQGLPDRSWILRWGFDRTLAKMQHQVAAVRDYLAPSWSSAPPGLSVLFGGREDLRVLFVAGSWLSFLGLLSALRHRRSLVALLALAFTPYIAFLVIYWHANEERYFVALMPWLALFAALALWRIYDRIATIGNRRLAPVALVVVLVLFGQVVLPSVPESQLRLNQWSFADSDRDAYAWAKTHLPIDATVMTRNPWQFNWHAERAALMVPSTKSREHFFQIARYYNIRYLVIDVGQRPDATTRKLLDQLLADPAHRFTPIYTSAEYPIRETTAETTIYEFPADYGNVPELRP